MSTLPYSTFSPVAHGPLSSNVTTPQVAMKTLVNASAAQLSEWVATVDGMTEKGKVKAVRFIKNENISGFVLGELRGNYDVIK